MIDINFVLNHLVECSFNLFAPGNLKSCKINFRASGSLFPNVVNRKFIYEPTGGTCQKSVIDVSLNAKIRILKQITTCRHV